MRSLSEGDKVLLPDTVLHVLLERAEREPSFQMPEPMIFSVVSKVVSNDFK